MLVVCPSLELGGTASTRFDEQRRRRREDGQGGCTRQRGRELHRKLSIDWIELTEGGRKAAKRRPNREFDANTQSTVEGAWGARRGGL